MGNTVLEKESIEHCGYTVMFTFLSGFMGISSTPPAKADRVYMPASQSNKPVPNRLSPVGAVQGAVLDGLAQMLGGDVFGCLQVGYGTRHFQDAVVSAGRESQTGYGIFQ